MKQFKITIKNSKYISLKNYKDFHLALINFKKSSNVKFAKDISLNSLLHNVDVRIVLCVFLKVYFKIM